MKKTSMIEYSGKSQCFNLTLSQNYSVKLLFTRSSNNFHAQIKESHIHFYVMLCLFCVYVNKVIQPDISIYLFLVSILFTASVGFYSSS